MTLRLSAATDNPLFYFPGSITKLDFWGDFFVKSGNFMNFMKHGLPKVIYLIDFTDPEYTQYFRNRVSSGYADAVRGTHNHTDIADIYFNPVNGFAMTHYAQRMMLPLFQDVEETDFNQIVHIKFKAWGLNHWSVGNMYYHLWGRWRITDNWWRLSVRIRKVDYATSIRGEWKTNYHRHRCNSYTSPNGHLAYTAEYGYNFHLFVSHIDQYESLFIGCNGYIGGTSYTDPKLAIPDVSEDYYLFGGYYAPGYTFYNRPFRDFDATMQLEVVLQLLVITSNGYKSNPDAQYPNACAANTVEQYGPGPDGYMAICSTDYNNYHEVNMCIRNPIADDFTDCAHDMDSVGGNCHRCLRYYGKTGTQGCFKCYDNCIECTGGASDQCTYCGQGYGFTGTSCKKCAADETWDLSKNICQKEKVKFMEADYGLETFGEIVLKFTPLDGDADLSLYVENMFDRYWITDINMQYYLVRDYTDLPLHRKVSISWEFIMVDAYQFNYLWVAVDSTYVWVWSPNLEDPTMGSVDSYWGYNYEDTLPTKVSYTNFHSAPTMQFGLIGQWSNDWATIWFRELNVTFFGCYEACATCWEDNSPVHCTSCLDGYYLVGTECKACNPVCNTCEGSPTNCKSCPAGEFLKGDTCFITCGLGYFPDALDNNNCKLCPAECVQCNSLTSCNSCKNGFFLSLNACLPCDTATAQCVTCVSAASKCLSCQAGLKLKDFTCVASCGAAYYEIPGNICNACPPGCSSCDASSCTACSPGFMAKSNICANPCGNGWYALDANTCAQCDSKCATCSASASNCLTCAVGRASDAPTCTPCASPCVTCGATPSTCLSCSGSNFLSGNSCVEQSSCPPGTFARNNMCEPCDLLSCATCVDTPSKCLSCTAPAVLSGTTCLSSCPSGFSVVGSICCPAGCSACSNSSTCSACRGGFYLSGVACPTCDSTCSTCTTSATRCLSCPSPNKLQQASCLPSCTDGFYLSGATCLACHPTCSTCSGPEATDCLLCTTSHVLWEGVCQDCSDPENAFFTVVDSQCWDKCGTGNRFTSTALPGLGGYNSCDDGNLFAGDGCSADCKIEKNFRCEGGSPTARDTCFSMVKPVASLHKIFADKFQVRFSSPVEFLDEDLQPTGQRAGAFNVTIDDFSGFGSSASFGAADADGRLSYFNISLDIGSSVDSTLNVNFLKERIRDANLNALKNDKVSHAVSLEVPDRIVLETPSNYTAVGRNGLQQFTVASSFVFSNYIVSSFGRAILMHQLLQSANFINVEKSSEMEWMLGGSLNHTQIGSFSPFQLIREKYTGESLDPSGKTDPVPSGTLARVLQEAGSSGTGTGQQEEAGEERLEGFDSLFSPQGSTGAFKRLGYTNAMLPNLSVSVAVMLLSAFLYFAMTVCCFGCVTAKSNCLLRFAAFGVERMFFLSMVFCTFELTLFAMNNVFNPTTQLPGGLVSLVLAFFTLVFVALFHAMLYRLANEHYSTLWHPEYYQRYGYLYCEFKLNSRVSKAWLVFFLARMNISAVVLASLQFFPALQTAFLLALNVVFLLLQLRFRPFVSFVVQLLANLAELFWAVSSLLFFVNALDDSSGLLGAAARRYIDIVNLCVLCLAFAFSVLAGAYMAGMHACQTVKRLCSRKRFNRQVRDLPAQDVPNSSGRGLMGEEEANKIEVVQPDQEGEEDFAKEFLDDAAYDRKMKEREEGMEFADEFLNEEEKENNGAGKKVEFSDDDFAQDFVKESEPKVLDDADEFDF